ncbi:aminodeoxychorismate synthase, component I [Pseudalkalibacillus berkeleyi]|uniref:Aminodeoxychorismate synthase, component I n=1 Tax=Pseudalkalibacillus berkeleyi TaxID=1069813 RepID=A0ABS9H6R4_9BACL|nr:aminodeoxychorismate synthase, component I [Pseudalkalibacillus berkeleyi]MCF6139649.1 aminodeoxychorismate synthase, component I [Pseudalkalibacillus berkeleyi]
MQKFTRFRFSKTIENIQNDWFEGYQSYRKGHKHHVLLESGRGGRFHIIGACPSALLKGKGDTLEIHSSSGVRFEQGDLLALAEAYLNAYEINEGETRAANLPDFKGGAIGYISYDIARQIETLPVQTIDDMDMPDLYFMIFEEFVVYDKTTNALTLVTHLNINDPDIGMEKLNAMEAQWFQTKETNVTSNDTEKSLVDSPEYSMDEEAFTSAVKQVQEYIRSGDVFQVNLSVRQSQPLHSEPHKIYEHLRNFNPSPYMGYMETPDFQLVNGSPELLVKKQGDHVSTRPIAGTRSRGKTPEEDEALAKTLIENEKERAEHVMLVDLERNDLGRVCQYGTVEVNEFMVIEKYSHVMHIVSNVQGMLHADESTMNLVRATFPGGTITGAPKVRTMEIIEELEPVRRGVYTGSIGWIGFDGDTELNIAIRTMICKGGKAFVQAGAGIVIDSDPQAEFKESLKKAKALWHAKELSEKRP